MVSYMVVWILAIAWCLLTANTCSLQIHCIALNILAVKLNFWHFPCMGIGKHMDNYGPFMVDYGNIAYWLFHDFY